MTRRAPLLVAFLLAAGIPLASAADAAWLREGARLVFVGSDHHEGPFLPVPAHLWDPVGWTRHETTVTRVTADEATLRYEGCVAFESVHVALHGAEKVVCRVEEHAYDLGTRASADGSHCAVVWLTREHLDAREACLGEASLFRASYLPPALATYHEPWTNAPGKALVFELGTGLLVTVQGDLEHARRVAAE